MKASELIGKLQVMVDQCGDLEVRVFSNDYYLDIHKVVDVTDGYHNGWNSVDCIGIEITK